MNAQNIRQRFLRGKNSLVWTLGSLEGGRTGGSSEIPTVTSQLLTAQSSLLRALEKPFSSNQPITTMPTKPCPSLLCLHSSWKPPETITPSPCSNIPHHSKNNFFPNIQSEPSLEQPEAAVSSHIRIMNNNIKKGYSSTDHCGTPPAGFNSIHSIQFLHSTQKYAKEEPPQPIPCTYNYQ